MTEIQLSKLQLANYVCDELHKDKPFNLVLDRQQADVFFLAAEGYPGDLRLSISHKPGITNILVDNSNADAIDRMLSIFITKHDRFGVVQSLKEVS